MGALPGPTRCRIRRGRRCLSGWRCRADRRAPRHYQGRRRVPCARSFLPDAEAAGHARGNAHARNCDEPRPRRSAVDRPWRHRAARRRDETRHRIRTVDAAARNTAAGESRLRQLHIRIDGAAERRGRSPSRGDATAVRRGLRDVRARRHLAAARAGGLRCVDAGNLGRASARRTARDDQRSHADAAIARGTSCRRTRDVAVAHRIFVQCRHRCGAGSAASGSPVADWRGSAIRGARAAGD